MKWAKLPPFSSSPPKLSVKPKPIFNTSISLENWETLLNQCQNLKQFDQILSQMILTGFIRDVFAASRLLKFSASSPYIHLRHTLRIFYDVENPHGFIYNTLMKASVKRNSPQNAMVLYKSMLNVNVSSDNYTFPVLIQASSERMSVFEGKQVHNHVLKMGFDSDVYVGNTLINMYNVCGCLSDARKLFDESPVLDLVSWNSMLAGYVRVRDVEKAKFIYARMPKRNVIASNSMIVLFSKTGNVAEAQMLFYGMRKKDLVSWSALLSCYEQSGMYQEALDMFVRMNADGFVVDEIVMVSVLSACSQLSDVRTGKMVHDLVVKRGIGCFVSLANALIHMYSSCGEITAAEILFSESRYLDQISWNSMISGNLRCGLLGKAKGLFNFMPMRDIVSWSIMISGYAQHNLFLETLSLFHEMLYDGIRPDEMILVSVISACTHLATLDQGKWIHAYIMKNGLNINIILGTTLIDMYMKCAHVENAIKVFHAMEEKGISTWNALIVGLAMNGLAEKSLAVFSDLKTSGMMPNEITFIGILGACRHIGLVDEGRHHFNSMIWEHKIKPNIKHYGCMVDLLGRTGMLKEAEQLIQSMPMAPDGAVWGALLGACKKYGDHEMGERIGRKLVELQPDHDGLHVLLSDIYASKGCWDNVHEIREMMMQHKVLKTPGSSTI